MPKNTPAKPATFVERCRRLLCQIIAPQAVAPFYHRTFERRLTAGELRRRLRPQAGDPPDPRPFLQKLATRMAARCRGLNFSFPPPARPTDFICKAELDPGRTWIDNLAAFCRVPLQNLPGSPPPPERINWSFAEPVFPDVWDIRQSLRRSLLDHLLDHGPKRGGDAHILFTVHTAAGLTRALPGLNQSESHLGARLGKLLQALRLPPGLSLFWNLPDNGSGWTLAVLPMPDWPTVREKIMADLSRPSTEDRLSLSYNAARLYDWIEALRPGDMLGDWSPPVEPVGFTEIGFDPDPATGRVEPLSELIEEINTNTKYSLSLQRWSQEKPVVTRIRVARTPLSLYEGVSEIKRHVGELRPGERAVLTITIQPSEKHRIV